jgi:hypothetical protein
MPRAPPSPGQFHFFVWDGERTLENAEANTIHFDDDQSPMRLFQKLRENPEFRMQFADRVQQQLLGDGALTQRHAAERFQAWIARLDTPIVAESARWGDYRRDVHPYKVGPYFLHTREEHWRPETRRIIEQFFPRRPQAILKQFRRENLYPKIDPPVAQVKEGKLEFGTTSAAVYYTLDGTDPRLPGGKISSSAKKYEGPAPITSSVSVKARTLAGAAETGEWSALVEF